MAKLGNSAFSHKLGVVLLLIYLEALPVQDSSTPAAPSGIFKVDVSPGQTGHSETLGHNKWKCPISASRHEVYSCHWCHQIKFTLRSQSYQSLPCFLAYNSGTTEPSTGAFYTSRYNFKAFGSKINESRIYKVVHSN